MSSLCAIKHSPSAWAGFATKLTVTVARTKLCTWILRPALMGDLHSTTRSRANALRCGVAVTGLHAHVVFSAKLKPSTASVSRAFVQFPEDLWLRRADPCEFHDALQRFVVSSVERRRSVPTVMTFPRRNSHVFSLSELSEVNLGDASKLR